MTWKKNCQGEISISNIDVKTHIKNNIVISLDFLSQNIIKRKSSILWKKSEDENPHVIK